MMHGGIHLLRLANKHLLDELNLRQLFVIQSYLKKQFCPFCLNLKNQNQSKIAEIRRQETLLSKRQIYEKIFFFQILWPSHNFLTLLPLPVLNAHRHLGLKIP